MKSYPWWFDASLKFFGNTFFFFGWGVEGRQLEEKAIDIVNSGCLLLRDEINNLADEKRIDELEYILSRCMVESAELLRENPQCKQWLPRVDKEYKEVTAALTELVTTWCPILKNSIKRVPDFTPHVMELFQKHLPALSTCISSAYPTGDFSDCYHELQNIASLDRHHIGEVLPLMPLSPPFSPNLTMNLLVGCSVADPICCAFGAFVFHSSMWRSYSLAFLMVFLGGKPSDRHSGTCTSNLWVIRSNLSW